MSGSKENRSATMVVEAIYARKKGVVKETIKKEQDLFVSYFMKRQRMNGNEAKDLYFHCFSIFYEKVRREKITKMTSKISSYLIRVGMNTILNEHKRGLRYISLDMVTDGDLKVEEIPPNPDHKFGPKVTSQIAQLSGRCKEIIRLKFENGLTIEQIARKLEEKENTIKVRLVRCMRYFKELMVGASKLNEDGK